MKVIIYEYTPLLVAASREHSWAGGCIGKAFTVAWDLCSSFT